jgi:hypothetical protein
MGIGRGPGDVRDGETATYGIVGGIVQLDYLDSEVLLGRHLSPRSCFRHR